MKTVAKRLVTSYEGQTFSSPDEARDFLVNLIAMSLMEVSREARKDARKQALQEAAASDRLAELEAALVKVQWHIERTYKSYADADKLPYGDFALDDALAEIKQALQPKGDE